MPAISASLHALPANSPAALPLHAVVEKYASYRASAHGFVHGFAAAAFAWQEPVEDLRAVGYLP